MQGFQLSQLEQYKYQSNRFNCQRVDVLNMFDEQREAIFMYNNKQMAYQFANIMFKQGVMVSMQEGLHDIPETEEQLPMENENQISSIGNNYNSNSSPLG